MSKNQPRDSKGRFTKKSTKQQTIKQTKSIPTQKTGKSTIQRDSKGRFAKKGTTKQKSAPKTHPTKRPIAKKQQGSRKKSITLNVQKLHPFKATLSRELLSFSLTNNFAIKNSNANISKIRAFYNNIDTQIFLFNAQSARPIKYARMIVKYKATNGTTQYFSTKKAGIKDIDSEIGKLLNNLTLSTPTAWESISPKNREFIESLVYGETQIYEFDEITIRYYY